MFSKLLKHELKANTALFLIIYSCVIGLAVITGVLLRINILAENSHSNLPLSVSFGLFMPFAILAVYGCMIAIPIILLVRFFRTHFSDQGYLTFTLPVKTSAIFLSSAFNILIWTVGTFIVVIISVLIFFAVGLPQETVNSLQSLITQFDFAQVFQEIPASSNIVSLITLVINAVYSIVMPMSAIVIGATVAKKHKILAAIGIGYGISVVNEIISGVLSATIPLNTMTTANALIATDVCSLIAPLFCIIGGYFLSVHLMKNKLNLP